MANKSKERKLAEALAKKNNIKIKSAMRRIQRAVKAEKPIKGITRRQKQYFEEYKAVRKYKERQKEKPISEPKQQPGPPEPKRRVNFDFQGTEVFKLYGVMEMGSGKRKGKKADVRTRWVKDPMTAEEINAILNAETIERAIEIFEHLVGFVAEVHEPEHFEFRGEYYGPEFWGE